jgi:5-methylcytosine-specific restriction endonuclease McrA
MNTVLQLNADYAPMKLTTYERAVELLLEGKAYAVASVPDRFIRSEKLVLPWPSVIALRKYSSGRPDRVKFSTRSVVVRDNFSCAYCGLRPTRADGRPDRDRLTADHVIPRAQAKEGRVYLYWAKKWSMVTTWENCVCACKPCNQRKADRTPAQARMGLRFLPRRPTQGDVLRMSLWRLRALPPEWAAYVPAQVDAAEEGEPALALHATFSP